MRLRTLRNVAVATTGAAAISLAVASPAFASFAVPTAYGGAQAVNGSASINRSGSSVTVDVALNSGSTFASTPNNFTVCASTSAFTGRATGGGNCKSVTNGEYSQFTDAGSTASETVTLGSAFTNGTAHLQIHLGTNDGAGEDTTFACWTGSSSTYYGDCAVNADGSDANGSDLPSGGIIGGIALVVVLAVGFGVWQWSSRRRVRA